MKNSVDKLYIPAPKDSGQFQVIVAVIWHGVQRFFWKIHTWDGGIIEKSSNRVLSASILFCAAARNEPPLIDSFSACRLYARGVNCYDTVAKDPVYAAA